LKKEKEARTGIEHDESVHIRGADVGSIVEERARKEDAGMWTTEATIGSDQDVSVHVRGTDIGLFVEETEREAQVGMWWTEATMGIADVGLFVEETEGGAGGDVAEHDAVAGEGGE
jgi:hypothetical protein